MCEIHCPVGLEIFLSYMFSSFTQYRLRKDRSSRALRLEFVFAKYFEGNNFLVWFTSVIYTCLTHGITILNLFLTGPLASCFSFLPPHNHIEFKQCCENDLWLNAKLSIGRSRNYGGNQDSNLL